MPAPSDPEKYLEWKANMSKVRKGRKPWNAGLNYSEVEGYEDYRRKLSEGQKGRKHAPVSEETKQKISNSLKGVQKGKRMGFANGGRHSEETKRKMSESHTGKIQPLSEDTKVSISKSLKKYFADPETRKAFSERQKQVLSDPEVRAKVSEGNKKFFASEKGMAFRQKLSKLTTERQAGSTLPESHRLAISKGVSKAAVEGKLGYPKNFKSGVHHSPKAGEVKHRSSFELDFYKQLDSEDQVLTYIVEPFRIPYQLDSVTRHYVVDLCIIYKDGNYEVVEVKPEYAISDPDNQAKFEAAEAKWGDRFCLVTEKELYA